MKIISDQILSRFDPDTQRIEHKSGSYAMYDEYSNNPTEDHLVTLDIGIIVHVFKKHGEVPTIEDVMFSLYHQLRNHQETYSDRSIGGFNNDLTN